MFESQRFVVLFIYLCIFITVDLSEGSSWSRALHPQGKGEKNVVLLGNSAKLFKLGFTDNSGAGGEN